MQIVDQKELGSLVRSPSLDVLESANCVQKTRFGFEVSVGKFDREKPESPVSSVSELFAIKSRFVLDCEIKTSKHIGITFQSF